MPRIGLVISLPTHGLDLLEGQGYIYCMNTYSGGMAQTAKVPRLRYARPGANPTLETIEYVLGALQEPEGPISRNQILATLAHWGHSTTRPSLNAALAFLGDEGMVAEGSKGLIWVPAASPQLLEAIRKGPRL